MIDLSEVRKLEYYEVVVNDGLVLKQMDTLLRRLIGKDAVLIIVSDKINGKPIEWKFHFWATNEEFEIIYDLVDRLMADRLDEEYKELLKG